MTPAGLDTLGRGSSWSEVSAVVAGFGVSGYAAADSLQHQGASVIALDDADTEALQEKATILRTLGVDVRLGPGSAAALPDGVDLVIASPGWAPTAPLIAAALDRGVPV